MELDIILINILYVISFACSAYIGLSLLKLKKGPLIGIYCCAYCLLCCNVLSGIIFKNDLLTAPKAFCFFQGYMVQFICYITSISVLCFSHEIYSLLVNFNRSKFFEHKTIYYLLTVIYPLIFGVPLFIVCLKTGAIIPRELKCDVANPIWVRLLGYSGANFVLSIPGAYFSARSAYVLYKHLDQFKKFSSSEDISQCSFSQNHQKYNMTKDVVFRMFILSSCIILINFLASIGTILCIIGNKPFSTKLNLNDWIGSIMGICTFLIFGFSREIRNAWR